MDAAFQRGCMRQGFVDAKSDQVERRNDSRCTQTGGLTAIDRMACSSACSCIGGLRQRHSAASPGAGPLVELSRPVAPAAMVARPALTLAL